MSNQNDETDEQAAKVYEQLEAEEKQQEDKELEKLNKKNAGKKPKTGRGRKEDIAFVKQICDAVDELNKDNSTITISVICYLIGLDWEKRKDFGKVYRCIQTKRKTCNKLIEVMVKAFGANNTIKIQRDDGTSFTIDKQKGYEWLREYFKVNELPFLYYDTTYGTGGYMNPEYYEDKETFDSTSATRSMAAAVSKLKEMGAFDEIIRLSERKANEVLSSAQETYKLLTGGKQPAKKVKKAVPITTTKPIETEESPEAESEAPEEPED
jgi:hypothetical protein